MSLKLLVLIINVLVELTKIAIFFLVWFDIYFTVFLWALLRVMFAAARGYFYLAAVFSVVSRLKLRNKNETGIV